MSNRFDPWEFIHAVAAVSRADGKMPDPEKGVGRECHAFSEEEDRVHNVAFNALWDILSGHRIDRDFRISRDSVGNLYVTFFGTDRELLPFCMCSHLDSVKNGGKYDGVAGVAAALAVLDVVAHLQDRPRRGFSVHIYRSEESSPKNGVGCLGSSIATGTIAADALDKIKYDETRSFQELFPSDRWPYIKRMCTEPVVSTKTICGSLEVHIEQSAVLASLDEDIGIVVEGIGGAWREKVDPFGVPIEVIQTPPDAFCTCTLECIGRADHTGGTPPNPLYFRRWPSSPLYRKDALVASGHVLGHLLRDSEVRLLRSEASEDSGFTSIPSRQLVEILVPLKKVAVLSEALTSLNVWEKFGVRIDAAFHEYIQPEAEVLHRSVARRYANIPCVVASLSTKAHDRESGAFGTTRATVVDFHLSPRGLWYKLDGREVNRKDGEALALAIRRRGASTFGEYRICAPVSQKKSQPVDQKLVDGLKFAANELGISFAEMPSLPGHDSDRHAEAGIPVSMIFLRQQDGVSHSPYEKLEESDFDIGLAVAKKFVLNVLAQ